MTTVTGIPTGEAPSIDEILKRGVCAQCHKPLAGHFNAETKAWELCENVTEQGDLPATSPHPLRRATDVVVMVPVTMLTDALMFGTPPSPAKGTTQERRTIAPRSATSSRVTRYPTRGKPAGRYVPNPNKPPTRMTESINRVWFAMKSNKRGIVAKQLAERLGMSDGTMAWVLAQLVKQGSIIHVRPGDSAPNEK